MTKVRDRLILTVMAIGGIAALYFVFVQPPLDRANELERRYFVLCPTGSRDDGYGLCMDAKKRVQPPLDRDAGPMPTPIVRRERNDY